MILVFLWCVGWLLPFSWLLFCLLEVLILSSSEFVPKQWTIRHVVMFLIRFVLVFIFFSFLYFVWLLSAWFRWMFIRLRKASNISKNASSKVINISPMMAVESSFSIQWVGSCKQYRCWLLSVFSFSVTFWIVTVDLFEWLYVEFGNLIFYLVEVEHKICFPIFQVSFWPFWLWNTICVFIILVT